jgi:hypothetical protein
MPRQPCADTQIPVEESAANDGHLLSYQLPI